TAYQYYLSGGPQDRSALVTSPAPWGPWEVSSEFTNPIIGFWTFLRFTATPADGVPYHAFLTSVGNNFDHGRDGATGGSVYFQNYELMPGTNRPQTGLPGGAGMRFALEDTPNAPSRKGLQYAFDFYPHQGNTKYPSMSMPDTATYPPAVQLLGCFTDGRIACGNQNPTHGIAWGVNGAEIQNGYGARFETVDLSPAINNSVSVPTFAGDASWAVQILLKCADLNPNAQGLFEAGAPGGRVYAAVSE